MYSIMLTSDHSLSIYLPYYDWADVDILEFPRHNLTSRARIASPRSTPFCLDSLGSAVSRSASRPSWCVSWMEAVDLWPHVVRRWLSRVIAAPYTLPACHLPSRLYISASIIKITADCCLHYDGLITYWSFLSMLATTVQKTWLLRLLPASCKDWHW